MKDGYFDIIWHDIFVKKTKLCKNTFLDSQSVYEANMF